jgi:hypothetical protein
VSSTTNSEEETKKAMNAALHVPTDAQPMRKWTPEKATNTGGTFSNPYNRQKSSLRNAGLKGEQNIKDLREKSRNALRGRSRVAFEADSVRLTQQKKHAYDGLTAQFKPT